jgi:integrase/recombinase XerD
MPARGQRRPRPPAVDGDPAGFGVAIGDYLEWLAVRNYSPRTIEDRRKSLGYLAAWLAERGVTRPGEVTLAVLERYQRHLFHYRKPNGAPLAFRTQLGRLVAVRALFRWLVRQHRIGSNPASELELPRVEHRLPKAVLSAGEAEQVLAVPDLGDPLGLRDRAILEVLYSTGMRRAELVGLAVADLDVERGTVIIRQGKGRKDRTLPLGERAGIWVDRYLADVRPQLVVPPDDGWLFLTHRGDSLTPVFLTHMARGYVNASGVGKTGACHLFRHTMATLMLDGGADVRYVQEMLGHASLATTQVYTQVSIARLKAVHAACHPAATNTRHRSPNQPTPPDTPRHDNDSHGEGDGSHGGGDVEQLLAVLDQEDDEENRPPSGSARRSAAGDTTALDDLRIEEHHHDHHRPRAVDD